MTMNPAACSRRAFLRTATAAGLALAGIPSRVLGANDAVRVAVIGLGNKGSSHVAQFGAMAGARLVALCDVDPERLAKQQKKVDKKGRPVFCATDPLRILERKDVDAVVIATPNHWHTLLAVWACQAGKDVYVEKPVSHNIWEGRQLVRAAGRYSRIVQAGTQYRSDPGLREAADYIQQGQLGKVRWIHVPWYELRPGIGKAEPYIPTGLDYDLYCGPAALEPLRRPRLHYDWHWFWSTGDGDMANSTVHPLDACRIFMPGAAFPRRVLSLGGRFTYDDGALHQANFLQALRRRRTEDLNAPIAEGHISSAVCHLANLSYLLGQPGKVSACQDALGKHAPVAEGFPRLVKSLEGIGVDLDKTPFTLGPWLELDPASGDILKAGAGDAAQLDQAQRLARGTHRAPFVLPT